MVLISGFMNSWDIYLRHEKRLVCFIMGRNELLKQEYSIQF